MHRSSLHRLRLSLTSLLVVMMLAGSVLVPGAAAAQQQSFVSQLTGVTITYNSPYQPINDLYYVDENMEMIAFAGSADILAMGFLPALIDLNGARDVFLDGLFGEFQAIVNLDAGSYDGVSYSLDIANVDGVEMGVFSLFMNKRSHGFAEFAIFIAPPVVFGAAMQLMQNSIAIDGVGLMRGVNPTVMGEMVLANVGVTGGTAATDVTEIQQSTEQQTTTTAQTNGAGRDAYLTQVQAEFAFYTTHLQTVLETTNALADQTITAQEARPIMDEAHAALALSNNRAAAISAPAGMESFHSEFLATAESMTTMGVTWQFFVSGNATAEEYSGTVTSAMAAYGSFATALDREMNSSGTEAQTTTSSTSTDTADASQYLAAIQGQLDTYHISLTNFTDNLGQFSGATTDAQKQAHIQATVDEALSWSTYLDTANSLTPPPGYESVHAAYIAWATEVTALGDTWMGFLRGEGPTTEDFSLQLGNVQAAEEALAIELASAGSAQTTTNAGDDTGATDTSSRSNRTTRGSSSDVTPEATEESSRTGRTTRGSTTDVTPEATETSSRTSRTTQGTDPDNALSNISETKGTRGTSIGQTTTAVSEWLAPQFDVLFTWDDAFMLYEGQNGSTNSDTASGLDQLNLRWEDDDGNIALVLITVMEGKAGDPAFVAEALAADPAAVEEYFGAGAELVDYTTSDDASGMLIHIVSDTSSGWLYTQFTCLDASCSQLVRVQVVSDDVGMPAALQDMRRGLAADDISITDAMRVRTVESAIDEYGN